MLRIEKPQIWSDNLYGITEDTFLVKKLKKQVHKKINLTEIFDHID